MLFASDLAAVTGRHRYQSVEEAQLKLWRRLHPKSFRAAQERCERRLCTDRETVDELMPNPAAADFFYDRANMIGRNFQAMIFALNS